MSLSRVIKSPEGGSDGLTEFLFKPIRQLEIAAPQKPVVSSFTPTALAGPTTGFVPMSLVSPDAEEIPEQLELVEPEMLPEPEGITLTEEELDQRLRESFQSGLHEGKNLAEQGLLTVCGSLRTAAAELHALREKVVRESEDEIVKLIMMVAAKVIQREVAQDGQRILADVVKAATANISARDEVFIHLHPDDYAHVTTRKDSLHKESLPERAQFRSDPDVLPGGCRVDTEMGTIDASFDSQLDEIFRRLQEERSMMAEDGAERP